MIKPSNFIINPQQLAFSINIFAISVVISFYAFGTFGFLNLFGLRTIFQMGIVLFSFFGLLAVLSYKYSGINKIYIYFTAFGLLYYAIAYSFTEKAIFTGLVQSFLMIIICFYLLFTSKEIIQAISKSIIILSFIFTVMGFIAYATFLINPSISYNINIYDSTTGSAMIHPYSWIEYFSFTSGDGFSFFGIQVTRLKGFCNEPSATIVHYLAPVSLALLYSKRYRIMGYIMLLFNLFTISSLIGIIIIFASFIAYFLMSIKNLRTKKLILHTSTMLVILIMLNPSFAESLILNFGNLLNEQTSYDLIARKNGSALIRLESFFIACQELLNHPFGFSSYNTMTGLIVSASLKGGWITLFLLIIFSFIIIKYAFIKFGKSDVTTVQKFGISLIISILFTAYFLSGYGWDRISGAIMLILFYRNLKLSDEKRFVYEK